MLRRWQAAFAGTPEAAAKWIAGYVAQGVEHISLRLVGDHERMLETVAELRSGIGG